MAPRGASMRSENYFVLAMLALACMMLQLGEAVAQEAAQHAHPKHNYVLTSIMGEPAAAPLHVFLRSWRRFSPDARIVVFTDGRFPEHYLRELGAHEVHTRLGRDWSEARFLLERFFVAANFVRERQQEMELVVVCDMTDVAVQADVFRAPAAAALAGAEPSMLFMLEGDDKEPAYMHDPQRPLNGQWYEACFGSDALAAIGQQRVSCAGFVLGNVEGVLRYGRAMRRLAKVGVNSSCLVKTGSDQGMHNHLLYAMAPRGELDFRALTSPNGELVLNIAYTYTRTPRINFKGEWLDRERRAPIPVLHQYKYRKAVTDLLEGMYPVADEWRVY